MTRRLAMALGALVMIVACGDDSGAADASSADDRPAIVVTTSVLGGVVSDLLGDTAAVVSLMPPGADPHTFALSARDAQALRAADAIVVNGGGFEHGVLDAVESAAADGVPVLDASELAGDGDPHFFTDVSAMAAAAAGLVDGLEAAVPRLREDAEGPDGAVNDLLELDEEIEQLLDPVPADRRVLVTNHDVFGPFADRYGFEVVGTVVGRGGAGGSASPSELADLAERMRGLDVPAIFVDESSSRDLAATVAAEVGDIELVALFTESLGGPGSGGETYADMMRTNATRIARALAPGNGSS